jgi:hypothetical protein
MSRPEKPTSLRLTEQDVLEQLPSLGGWSAAPQQHLPGPHATFVEIRKAKRGRRA